MKPASRPPRSRDSRRPKPRAPHVAAAIILLLSTLSCAWKGEYEKMTLRHSYAIKDTNRLEKELARARTQTEADRTALDKARDNLEAERLQTMKYMERALVLEGEHKALQEQTNKLFSMVDDLMDSLKEAWRKSRRSGGFIRDLIRAHKAGLFVEGKVSGCKDEMCEGGAAAE